MIIEEVFLWCFEFWLLLLLLVLTINSFIFFSRIGFKPIPDEVDEFNSDSDASGKDALSLKSMDVKKDVATMIIEFASTTDFGTYILKYNNPDKGTFYIGDISDNEDCEIKGKFYENKLESQI